jgi:hypothetical protein
MKKILIVLGCYGFMVGSAQAGERWPPGPCADVARVRVVLEKDRPPPEKAMVRLGVLLIQREHCGIDVKADMDADFAALQHEIDDAERRGRRAASPTPRQPMHCLTVPMSGGDSMTNCN